MKNLFPRHLSPVILTSLCALLAVTTAPLSAQAAGGIGKDGVTATKVFNVNVPLVGHPLKRESYNPVLKRDAEDNLLLLDQGHGGVTQEFSIIPHVVLSITPALSKSAHNF